MAAGCIYAGGGIDNSGAYGAGIGNGVQGGNLELGAAGHSIFVCVCQPADYPAAQMGAERIAYLHRINQRIIV